MRLTTLLPHLAGLRVARAEVFPDELTLELVPRTVTACCPACGTRSRARHSIYTRKVADQPLAGRRVMLHLQVRRFRCRRPTCPQRTFAEQRPPLVARYARRSAPLQAFVQDLGLTLGGRPGARFAARRAVAVSRHTLLRAVRALPEPPVAAPTVLGVDDFAVRRGQRYGSVLVDLQAHRPVDLLPDRRAASLAGWLTTHGQPAIICRDRGGEYARGARVGAPTTVQVADRWHLLKNVGEALERVIGRQGAALRAAVAVDPSQAGSLTNASSDTSMDEPPVPPASLEMLGPAAPAADTPAPVSTPSAITGPRAARVARYEAVVALARSGASISAISRQVGLTRLTVRRFLRTDAFPERVARPQRLHDATPEAAFLRQQWAAGCRNAAELWRALQAQGFAGSPGMVRRYVAAWRTTPSRPGRPARQVDSGPLRDPTPRPPTPRQVRWWLLQPAVALEPDQAAYLDRLRAGCPAVAAAATLAVEFGRLVRARDQDALGPWLTQAASSGLPELREVAAGLRRDRAAVEAALEYEWSSGQVEGQVTRLKLVKRQMYGRGQFDLLRKRFLLAG